MPGLPMANASENQDATRGVPIVPFEMDGHRFGLLAADVREVLRAATPSPLPRAPSVVLGVLNVHGTLVPVLDVRSRFRLQPRALRHTDHILIVTAGPRTVALAVEAANAMVEIPASTIDAARTDSYGEHVAGIVKLEDGTLVLYDLASFLTDAEAAELEMALSAEPPAPTG